MCTCLWSSCTVRSGCPFLRVCTSPDDLLLDQLVHVLRAGSVFLWAGIRCNLLAAVTLRCCERPPRTGIPRSLLAAASLLCLSVLGER